MYYVYVLQSEKVARLYKGCTTDLKKRLAEYNRGSVLSTKAYRPWKLIHYLAFAKKEDALREELFLKTGKGREMLKMRSQKELEK